MSATFIHEEMRHAYTRAVPTAERIKALVFEACTDEGEAIVALSIVMAEMLLHEWKRPAPSVGSLTAEFVDLAAWCQTNIAHGTFTPSELPQAEQFERALDLLQESGIRSHDVDKNN